MIDRKEKSPWLLEQTKGDTSKISYSSYPATATNVNGLPDSKFWYWRAARLEKALDSLKDFLDVHPDDRPHDIERMRAIDNIIADMEQEIEEAKADAEYNRELEAKEAALDEAEREAEYWRDAL